METLAWPFRKYKIHKSMMFGKYWCLMKQDFDNPGHWRSVNVYETFEEVCFQTGRLIDMELALMGTVVTMAKAKKERARNSDLIDNDPKIYH